MDFFSIFKSYFQAPEQISENVIKFLRLNVRKEFEYHKQWWTLAQILGPIKTWPYIYGMMTSHISIVLEQNTIFFQNIGGGGQSVRHGL